VQGSPARTLVSWRLRSEDKRDPWFFFSISIRGFETLLRHASLLPRNRTCESSFTRYMGSVHFPAYPGSLSLSLSLSLSSFSGMAKESREMFRISDRPLFEPNSSVKYLAANLSFGSVQRLVSGWADSGHRGAARELTRAKVRCGSAVRCVPRISHDFRSRGITGFDFSRERKVNTECHGSWMGFTVSARGIFLRTGQAVGV
jgi:hypothetical protein